MNGSQNKQGQSLQNANTSPPGNEQIEIEDRQDHFVSNYDILAILGSGGFGEVVKAREKSSMEFFAIKIIDNSDKPFTEEELEKIKKEVNLLSTNRSQYIVQYYDSWIESDNCFYIKTELCFDSLAHLIVEKRKCFGRQVREEFSLLEYFITSLMMKEIFECVKFLHKRPKPIIHRDLKPDNILICKQMNSHGYIKICDMGSAKVGKRKISTHTQGEGTDRYIAPEVNKAHSRYNHKADIWSLGVVVQDMFDLDLNSTKPIINDNLRPKLNHLKKMTAKKMLVFEYNSRLNCAKLLELFPEWGIPEEDWPKYQIPGDTNILENYPYTFLRDYYREKLKAITENQTVPRKRPSTNIVDNCPSHPTPRKRKSWTLPPNQTLITSFFVSKPDKRPSL